MERRNFLRNFLLFASTALFCDDVFASSLSDDKILRLHNVHTGENIKATFFANNQFIDSEIKRLNYFLRDYRLEKVANIDINLFSLLYAIQQNMHSKKSIDIISGYRSIQTNNYLRRHHHLGVAKNSYHTKARAIDFKIKDRYLKDVLSIAKLMEFGGVGYYPSNNFIHIDTGPVRFWRG